jgi:hypothetical protein
MDVAQFIEVKEAVEEQREEVVKEIKRSMRRHG